MDIFRFGCTGGTGYAIANGAFDPGRGWANLRIPGVTDFLAGMVPSTTGDEFLLTTSSEGLIL